MTRRRPGERGTSVFLFLLFSLLLLLVRFIMASAWGPIDECTNECTARVAIDSSIVITHSTLCGYLVWAVIAVQDPEQSRALNGAGTAIDSSIKDGMSTIPDR